jgi:hypothetical protein
VTKPLSQMPFDLVKRIDKIDRALDKEFVRETLRLAGAAAVGAQEDQMRADAGGDLILGRVRSGKGAKIGARTGRMTLDSLDIKAIGPVPLLANQIKAHQIPKVGPRARRRKTLAIPGVGPRASADHPGSPGKGLVEQRPREGGTAGDRDRAEAG